MLLATFLRGASWLVLQAVFKEPISEEIHTHISKIIYRQEERDKGSAKQVDR